ncbi:hypothetical protein [Alkalicoccus daliensis]|uniref:Uncharacterized protein n=1 Tax=Alkalicoccus daliensis TaxID=745820 RepID=A0A1H0KPK1_9BACI|nr:hypothetical protein [Alkalicoccus daliensis]SDO57701.1 hypothetical protein SAMN04488053_11916 [Alkalicoccus daliensis]
MSNLERDQYLKSVASFLTAQYGIDDRTAYELIKQAELKKRYHLNADDLLTVNPKKQAELLMKQDRMQ